MLLIFFLLCNLQLFFPFLLLFDFVQGLVKIVVLDRNHEVQYEEGTEDNRNDEENI